jgi:hypothetical protein
MNGHIPIALAVAVTALLVGGVIADTLTRVAATVGSCMTIGASLGALMALPPSRRGKLGDLTRDGAAWGAAVGALLALLDPIVG